MRKGSSLGARLLLVAGIFIGAAILVAAVAIFFVLHRFVQAQIDQRLDSQIMFLSSMLETSADGTVKLSGTADGPPFDHVLNGWYWQIAGPNNVLRSRSLADAVFDVPDLSARPHPPPPPPTPPGGEAPPPPGERPQPADGLGPRNQALHFRILNVPLGEATVTITASAPRAAVLNPLREAMTTLLVAMTILGAALVSAMLLQVRLGLRPLQRLRRAVADVRGGRIDSLPPEQPSEIEPLVSELNSLLHENAANLDRARRHVANLAHSLKTPLATLAVALPKDDDRTAELQSLVQTMERNIRHHLGRARIAALSGPVRTRTVVEPRVNDLGEVLRKINIDRDTVFISNISAGLTIACEPQDFDEMLGNLLDNAFRWAKTRVEVIASSADQRRAVIVVDDDGPGLDQQKLSRAIQVGQRLDESIPGFGFGLPITRELAELYGGELELARSPLGGLRVSLHLPLARPERGE